MAQFVIEGGHSLSGTIRASGNKNAAMPVLAASLLADKPVWIRNLPRIGDINTLLELLESMSVGMSWQGEYDVQITNDTISRQELDNELCHRVRGSILLAAPLLHRFGEITLPLPGGDRIGRRRIDTHILALQALGADVTVAEQLTISAPGGLKGADILLDEASVTATENTVMAASRAKGTTVIRNAACEPHVQDMCHLLNQMGADISGIGTNQLTVQGVDSLGGGEIILSADYLEVASLMILAAITDSEITIEQASPEHLRMILHQISRLGIAAEIRGEDLFVAKGQSLVVQPDYRGAIPKIDSSPWPGFPADLTSVATVAATQATGSVLIFEKMFESRMFFVDQLIGMGAQIVLCDPHRAVVIGPNRLHGARMTSPDIRAGMALLMASLCADGESTIGNVIQIDRGYERIDERLQALGARIVRQEG